MGCKEKYIPCGLVDEDTGQLHISFGSSYKTSDFLVDTLQAWWNNLPKQQQNTTHLLQLKIDNGPESSGVRTQFLKRMVEFADSIGKPIQLLYYPPYHSKYNPIERCWGILEQHWNGSFLSDVQTMLAWAQSMTSERCASCRDVEPTDLPKRHFTLQDSHARSREEIGT